MRFLILDGPVDSRMSHNPRYRGTYRSHPTYIDHFSADHPVNVYFSWFLREGGELGIVRDLSRAKEYVKILNSIGSDRNCFEVVQALELGETQMVPGDALGYDLSCAFNNSLLHYELQYNLRDHRLSRYEAEALDSLSKDFAPYLNRNGLFERADLASQCLESIRALKERNQDLFEGGDFSRFKVVFLRCVTGGLDGA
jgi:hypothetical protein